MANLYAYLLWALRHAQPFFQLFSPALEPPLGITKEASVATLSSTSRDATVVLGGGVIGLSTAYYLALALNETAPEYAFQKKPIYIVESSKDVCAGASRQATGGLGDFGFGPETAPLGGFSFRLHQQLAANADGRNTYHYSPLNIFRVSSVGNTSGTKHPADTWGPFPPQPADLGVLPAWVRRSSNWKVEILANGTHASHLDPERFCLFLLKRCESLGVTVLLNSSIKSVKHDERRQHFSSVAIQKGKSTKMTELPCKSLVISAGPWSDRVFSQLFPNAKVKIPLNVTGAAGNHMQIKNPRWNSSDDEAGVQQVFFNDVVPGSTGCDLTSFLGGSLYVGGYGAVPEPLPDKAEDVHVQSAAVPAMYELAADLVDTPAGRELEIVDVGRCYRPLAVPRKPIITKIDWKELGLSDPESCLLLNRCIAELDDKEGLTDIVQRPLQRPLGGLYVNTGHSSDGITLAPGSGKVMSELILGLPASVDISGLGLKSFQ